MWKKSKDFNFIAVQLGGYAYDYPKNTPIPRIGELISVDDSRSARVVDISYIIIGSNSDKPLVTITIYTRTES